MDDGRSLQPAPDEHGRPKKALNMTPVFNRGIRALLRQAKRLLLASRAGRSLLYDLNNRDEFTSLLSHERMLADRIRVDCYHEAINRFVQPDQTVIDLGTGTGILALFTAQQHPHRIYALDHSEFIEVAERIARHNGVDCIDFVRSNSRDFTPPEPVDLIIHEQIGDELLTENMIDNLLDLKRRCLKPGGRILPGRFELFLEPVQLRSERAIPEIWEQVIHGVDFAVLREQAMVDRYRPPDYDRYLLEPSAVEALLCEPEPILSFDLNAMDSPSELLTRARASRRVMRTGRMDGLALFFRVIFDEDLAFDTSPTGPVTHWRSRLFRTPARILDAGEAVSIELDVVDPTRFEAWRVGVQAGPYRQSDPLEAATAAGGVAAGAAPGPPLH
jgi:protein arginine N-methyltransferase 1